MRRARRRSLWRRVTADLRAAGRRDPRDLALLAEAALASALASLSTRVLPFRMLAAFASRPPRAPPPDAARRAELIARVRWAVSASSWRAPWRAACLQQSLAAQWMLKRRGVAAVLYYGAAIDREAGLAAHTWVKDAETEVIGVEAAPQFAIVAQFPPPVSD